MFPRLFSTILLSLIFSLTVFSNENWNNISSEELVMKKPQVEANADVEAIFWKTRINNKQNGEIETTQYVRLKIFTERGANKYNKLEFPLTNQTEDIEARIISPDGKITEISGRDFFVKEIAKNSEGFFRAKVAAIPNIQSGSILEYKYREITYDFFTFSNGFLRITFFPLSQEKYTLNLQKEIPIQNETFNVRLDGKLEQWEIIPENTQKVELIKDGKESNYYSINYNNIPSFNSDKREPFMPPDRYIKQRIIIRKKSKQAYSTEENLAILVARYSSWRKMIRENLNKADDIGKIAKNITKDAVTDEEKVRLIYEFCKREIKNVEIYYSTMTEKERKNIRTNKSLKEILKTKVANKIEILSIFGAMLSSLGFDVGLALGYDRKEYVDFAYKNIIPELIVIGAGIKIKDQWISLDPSNPFLPFGRLCWQFEGQDQIIVGEKDYWLVNVPQNIEKSLVKRSAKLKLSENGDLEGEVEIEHIGYKSFEEKSFELVTSKAELEQNILSGLKEKFRDAEIYEVKLENYGFYDQPYKYSYRIRILKYGKRTGKRIFLQPSYFESRANPLFYNSTRTYPIYFPYPWSEEDDITFYLPKDYQMEVSPNLNGVSDPDRISMLTMTIKTDEQQGLLKYKRNFYFGKIGGSLFINNYDSIKELFDSVGKADSRLLSLVKK